MKKIKITIETEKGKLTREVSASEAMLNDEEYWGATVLELLQTIDESDQHEF